MKESGKKQGAMSPCAACKLLRRRCAEDCVFAPYFPADDPHKFASVHKVFGASNVNKMLQELPKQQRSDAVSSMVYEANARVRDPVYGCVGAISSLQQQIDVLQSQLAISQAEVVHLRMLQFPSNSSSYSSTINPPPTSHSPDHHNNIINESSISPTNFAKQYFPNNSQSTKSFFAMDMVVDQPNMGESLWSF